MNSKINLAIAAIAVVSSIAVPARAALFGEDPRIQIDYAPESSLIVHGAIQIGTFTYQPATTGKLKPYELVSSGMGPNILLTQNVADFVRESLLKEFRFVGLQLGAGPALSGDIRAFGIDGTGVTLTIHYSVKDTQGTSLYEGDQTTKQRLGAGNVSPLDNPMARNFESLLHDPEFLKAINGSLGPVTASAEPSARGLPLGYVPSSAFIAGGAVGIGSFDYEPAARDKIAADQVRNTAIGDIHLDRPVAIYFSEAMLKEFRLAGISVESSNRIVSGTIVNLSCDDLGSSATWTLDVKYSVKDGAGNSIYEGEKTTKLATQKVLEVFNNLLRRNFEDLLLDETFLKAIGSPVNSGNVAETIVPSDGWNWTEWSAYGPRSALSAHGAVSVGSFAYPVATGKMKPTEIPNRALMKTVNADKPVAEVMHDLALNELRFTGIDVSKSDRILTGEIQRYKVDDISNPAEWAIAVRFVVKDKAGAIIYDAVKSATPTNKTHLYNFLEMKIVLEALLSDPEFIKAIN